jgi:hypothetical protein
MRKRFTRFAEGKGTIDDRFQVRALNHAHQLLQTCTVTDGDVPE